MQLSLVLRNEAFHTLENLSDKQQKVYDVIKAHPDCTNLDICRILGWQINRVTGRVSELQGGGRIIASGKRKNPESGKNNTTWKIAN